MRFNPATETQAFADVNAAAIDVSNFSELKSNHKVWDCQTGKWTLNSEILAMMNRQPVTV